MIREKILRLHRHKSTSSSHSSSSAQKFDFTFSNIQATQVPKGWDRIYLSLISPESGKTVRKSGKVGVKNGNCLWTETFTESIWISDIDLDEHLFKFLVATGTSKSSILGEAKLNLAAFLSSESPVLISLPLKNCSYGTVLQLEVKCLTPKTNPRDEKWKNINSPKEENGDDHECLENQSETSDSTTAKSVDSLSRNNISRATSYSFDSMDGSVGRQSNSSQSERYGGSNGFGRQDSSDSNESSSYGSYSNHGSVRSVRSLQSHGRDQREEFRKSCHAAATLLQPNLSSSRILNEGDDATVQELEAEAKMWEQNARKLAVDIERLRDELSDQNLSVTKANMELASSRLECQDLTQEIEQLKSLLEESEMKQNAAQEMEFQELGHRNIQKEMEDEIRFQKEENEHLFQQLNKTQESNIELISILQEMEDTIEKQKLEIESLTADRSNANDQVSSNESKSLNGSDLEASISEMSLLSLQCEISFLESAFQEMTIEIKIEEDLKNRVLKEFVLECNDVLAEREHRIMDLEAALSSIPLDHVDRRKGIKHLKEKVRGLEVDCNELTEENLDLLYELNELRMDVSKSSNFESEILQEEIVDFEDMDSIGKDGVFVSESSSKSVSEAMLISSNLGSHFFDDKIDEMRLMGSENNRNELMKLLSDLQQENIYLLHRVSGLEAQLRYFTDKSETSRLELQNSESIVMILENQIKELEEDNESLKVREKEKVYEMEKKWLEAEEARLSLGEANIRLQSTTESLMEEYNSLQEFNVELREQKQNLQSRCMGLESKARTFQDCCCKYAESMGNLRVKSSQNLENNVFQADDEENLMIMFGSVMECESKLKSIINELDSKLELSEGERLRLAEENSLLQMRLEKVTQLQKEVLALRVSVQETRSENEQLEASLRFMMRDYEVLIRDKASMAERIVSLQRSVSKEEDCRLKKNALEEKIFRLEGDLIARDALCVQDAETKNELNQMKIVNSQLVMKMKHLENVIEDLQRRAKEPLEHEVKQTRQDAEISSKSTSESYDSYQPQVQKSHQRSKKGFTEDLEGNDEYKSQLESGKESRESESKISLLEAELQEIRERYFEMSLDYAEVEDQREQLVMKLKSFSI